MNTCCMNPIDRSIIRINQAIPEIMDRMLEIYKAYAPKILETVSKRLDENGGRLDAYKHELNQYGKQYMGSNDGVSDFLDSIPFSALVKIVEPSLYKNFISKINEISELCNNNYNSELETLKRVDTNSNVDEIQIMVDRAVSDTEGYQKFQDYEVTGIFPGTIPSYGIGTFCLNETDKTKDPNFRRIPECFRLPVIGVYNKYNANLFNKIFSPETRILKDFSNIETRIDFADAVTKSKHLDERLRFNHNFSHQNIMLLDIDSIFNTISKFWKGVIIFNMLDTDSISKIDKDAILKLFHDKGIFPDSANYACRHSSISMACRVFHLLSLNQTTSPEYKRYFREFDLLHKFGIESWGLIKKQIVSSAITTYLANVCSRTQDFTNNMIDDVVNKYLTITAQDNSIVENEKQISTVRSKARDFYALFRNFLTTPSLDKRNMFNFDDIAISSYHSKNYHMSVRQFACYILKKIYEHECVTYNIDYNISNDGSSFKFIQTESMAKKMLVHIIDPEAKVIIEQHKDSIGNKSLLGANKYQIEVSNSNNPLVYLARNHRHLSSIYKQIFVAFINYIDSYRLKKNVTSYNSNSQIIEENIHIAKRKLLDSLKLMNRICSGSFYIVENPVRHSLSSISRVFTLPMLNISLFYDGQFHINYNLLDEKDDILLSNYSNRIIDVLSPKNLRRQNIGHINFNNRFCNENYPECNGGPICCCDGSEITCNHGMVVLSDIDDLSFLQLTSVLGFVQTYGNMKSTNIQTSQTPYTDFGQFDGELDSGLNSYESLDSKIGLKLTKIPSLKAIEKVALKLDNLKTIKVLDLATVAYSAQLAYEKLDFNSLSDESKKETIKSLKVIDSKLREVLNGRIYKSLEELNMNSMESIDFIDNI